MSNPSFFTLPVVFIVSLVVLVAAAELGQLIGRRTEGEANVSTLEAAILGLFALMISFTFSMALSRFEARRDALLTEANALGTTALRARLLPSPVAEQSLKLLQDYTQIRTHSPMNEYAPSDDPKALLRSNSIQLSLWRLAELAAVKDNSMVPMGLYLQSLNQTFDSQASRLAAMRNRVPPIVLLALYSIAVVAIAFAGFASGIEKRRWRLPVYTTSALAAGVILLIQDIEKPNTGFITISQQPLIDTEQAIDSYLADPKSAMQRK